MEIQWWRTNISTSHHFIRPSPPDTTIYSDASLDGRGATISLTTIGAPWEDMDDLPHINVLELYAAKLARTHCQGSHIQLKLDNFTAVSYINKMGGTHSRSCNNVTQDISISLHEQHSQTMSYMMNFSSVIENHMDLQQKIPSLGGYDPI